MDLSKKELELLRTSWKEISKVGIPQIGLLLLQRLFQDNPDVMTFYKIVPPDMNTTLEEMRKNRPVRVHSAILGDYVNKLVKTMDSQTKFQETLDQVGSAQVELGVAPEYFQAFGMQLFDVIETIMKCDVSCELMQVWKKFGLITQEGIIASMKAAV